MGLLVLASPTSAEVNGIELGLVPVGQPGSFFDVSMLPGETRILEVEIANHGSADIMARTYAADVYTIINGGFGGRLRGEAATGTTLWLDYQTELLDLAVGDRSLRSFTISVPADAGPGEYITSLILENEDAVEHAGVVGARQVVRQALGVIVTVPGVRSPAMEVGQAEHLLVAGRSVLSVAVSNPGNVRLKPLVELSLRDAGGRLVSHASVQMDTFYAVNDSTVEVPLDALLLPGTYTIEVAVEDVAQGILSVAIRGFTVAAEATPAPAARRVPGLTDVNQGEIGAFPWPAVALLAGVSLVIALFFFYRSRPRSRRLRTR